MQFLIEYVTQSFHKIKMTLKRTVTIDAPRPTKKSRNLKRQVNTLSRQVSSIKPEVRQESYYLQINAGQSTPINLIQSRVLQDAGTQQIRLHRIRISYEYVPGDALWGVLYGVDSGPNTTPLYAPTLPYDLRNAMIPLDRTTGKVYRELKLSEMGNFNPTLSQQVMELDYTFSTPKILPLESEGLFANSTKHICYIGGHRHPTQARNVYVTMWYTS